MLIESVENLDVYFEHFAALVHEKESAVLTGDLTPSHCALNSDQLKVIDSAFARRGIQVKAIQLVRDPIERIISTARMVIRNEKNRPPLLHEEIALIDEHFDNQAVKIRSDYRAVRESASRVFGDRFFECFYEELFNSNKRKELCLFLGIPYIRPDLGKFVNKSRTENAIPDRIRQKLFDVVADQYEYYIDVFGEEKIKSIWSGYLWANSR